MNQFVAPACWFFVALLLAAGTGGCDRGAPVDDKSQSKVATREKPAAKQPDISAREERPPVKHPQAADTDDAAPAESRPTEQAPPQKEQGKYAARVVIEPGRVVTGEGILRSDPLDSPVTEVPSVAMSAQHAATCLVKVDDPFPNVRLRDLSGNEQELAKLLGEKFTIVVFWSATYHNSVDELRELAAKVASPLAGLGVRVVGVNEGDAADVAREVCEKQGVSFPVLIDAEGKLFAQVATAKMPRTYLLDASGKILWFDIDYSRSTRRDLRDALRALFPR